jgi:hypothetical protein
MVMEIETTQAETLFSEESGKLNLILTLEIMSDFESRYE